MRSILCTSAIFIAIVGFSMKVRSAELIVNGGFETGTFTGWTAVNSPSAWMPWRVTGPSSLACCWTSVGPTTTAPGGGSFNAWNGMTDNITNNSTWSLFQSFTVPAGRAIRVRWHDNYQINHTDFCPGTTTTNPGCQPKFYYVEITNAAGTTVIQTLHTQSTIGNVNQVTGWVSHQVDVGGVGGQTLRLRFRGTETVPLSGPGHVEIDNVSVQDLVPSAATVTVSGRVATSDGQGITRAIITLTNAAGVSRNVLTNQFGYYRIDEVAVGETYTVSANSRKYFFANSPRLVTVNDELTNLDFTASP